MVANPMAAAFREWTCLPRQRPSCCRNRALGRFGHLPHCSRVHNGGSSAGAALSSKNELAANPVSRTDRNARVLLPSLSGVVPLVGLSRMDSLQIPGVFG